MKLKNLIWTTSAALALYNFSPVHASIQQVPEPVLAEIFSYLTPAEAAKGASTSKQFCLLANERTKNVKKEVIELIQKFCNNESLYGYQTGVQSSAKQVLSLTHVPVGLTQDQFDIARLNAINLIYGITISAPTKKEYATMFKNIYSKASPNVQQIFKVTAIQFNK
jgi:hypothetical protein